MTAKCEWCGGETDGKWEYVMVEMVPPRRFRICGECMNLAGNDKWDKLLDKVKLLEESIK